MRLRVGLTGCRVARGLVADSAYLADLDDEIAVTQSAYVATAVTEIATLRAELAGPQVG